YDPITATSSQNQTLGIDYGVVIEPHNETPAIWPGSPAAEAGLQEGDIITFVNDQRIDGTHTLDDVLIPYSPGDDVNLTAFRDSRSSDYGLKVGARPDL